MDAPDIYMGGGSAWALSLKTIDAPPADPLDGLCDEELRLLYYNARAELLRTLPRSTADLIRRGKCRHIVVARMRVMVGLGIITGGSLSGMTSPEKFGN